MPPRRNPDNNNNNQENNNTEAMMQQLMAAQTQLSAELSLGKTFAPQPGTSDRQLSPS